MRLRSKYAIVLVGILAVLGLVVVGSVELVKEQTIDREQEDLNETADLVADQLDREIRDRRDLVLFYASSDAFDQLGNPTVVLEQLVENSAFFGAEVVDANGTVLDVGGQIAPEAREAAIGSDASDREEVMRALEFLTTDVTAVNHTLGTIAVSAPIFETGEPEPSGVLVAVGNVGTYGELGQPDGSDGSTNGDGVDGGDGSTGMLSDVGLFDPIEAVETSLQTVTVRGETDHGERVTLKAPAQTFDDSLTSQAELNETDWQVAVERDEAALTDQLQFLQFLQIGSLLVVFGAVFGLGVYEYRTTLRQTSRLLAGFDALREGEYDHSMSMTEADEWEKISDGFNEMAAGIAEREQTIKEREAAIRERERRLSVLNRILRHNLQNDMTVIQGQAEMVRAFDDASRQEEAVERIIDASQGLISHSQKARKLEQIMESAEDDPVTIDVVQVTERQLLGYREDYPEFEITLDAPASAWVSVVNGVGFGIDSVIENAFEHTNSDGSDDRAVAVTIESVGDEVLISVHDTGPGVPEHEREVLTQDTETSLEHGSGIGLWLAYWAAVKSGGDLRFDDVELPDDEKPWGGCVTVALPATSADSESDMPGDSEGAGKSK